MQTGPLIVGSIAIAIGTGLLVAFARGRWIRRILRVRGVETTGAVRAVSKTKDGNAMVIAYTDQHGETHVKTYAMVLAKRGTETTVRYDPEKPSRAVVSLTKYNYFIWLVLGLLLTGWGGGSLIAKAIGG